jgi:hypothetical protein
MHHHRHKAGHKCGRNKGSSNNNRHPSNLWAVAAAADVVNRISRLGWRRSESNAFLHPQQQHHISASAIYWAEEKRSEIRDVSSSSAVETSVLCWCLVSFGSLSLVFFVISHRDVPSDVAPHHARVSC